MMPKCSSSRGSCPTTSTREALTVDVIMLAVTGGRERTTKELGRLLYAAGFQLDRVIDTTGRLRIAEAVLAEPKAATRRTLVPDTRVPQPHPRTPSKTPTTQPTDQSP